MTKGQKSILFYSLFIWLLSLISSEYEFSSKLLINFCSRDSIFFKLFWSLWSLISSPSNSKISWWVLFFVIICIVEFLLISFTIWLYPSFFLTFSFIRSLLFPSIKEFIIKFFKFSLFSSRNSIFESSSNFSEVISKKFKIIYRKQ